MKRLLLLLAVLVHCSAAVAQGDPWPMERQDRWGTGRALSGPDPSTQIAPWIKYRVASDLVSFGPAIRSDGIGFFSAWIPSLMTKFDLSNGSTQGSFDALAFGHSMPALGDGQVYMSTSNSNGRVFAIDPAIMDYNWTFLTNSVSGSDFDTASVTLGPDGDVVVPSTIGKAWRLNKFTGVPVWTKTGLSSPFHTIVFSRDDSLVFIAHGNLITAFKYSDGSLEWNFNAGSLAGAPSVAPDGAIMFGSDGGTVFALNPDGSLRWSWATLDSVRAAPVFSDNGRAYVSGFDRRLYCFDVASGARLWSYTGTNQMRQSPAVGFDGRIYVVDRVGRLYCVSPTGQLVWAVVVPSSEARGEMSIGPDGTVYVAGSGIYAITQAISSQEPEALGAIRGTLVSGGLPDILNSDNQYLRYNPGPVPQATLPPVDLTFDVTCPRTQLQRLDIKFESGASSVNLQQQLYMRDFNAGQWVEIDSRNTTISDSVVELSLSSNLNRFIQAGTRTVRLRASWKQIGPVFSQPWQVRVDHVRFGLLPAFVYP